MRGALLSGLVALAAFGAQSARAEDGYQLWLRYQPVEQNLLGTYRAEATELVTGKPSPTLDAAQAELERGLGGLLAEPIPAAQKVTRDGAVVIGTPQSSTLVAGLHLNLSQAGDEGYVIRSVTLDSHKATVIAANSDVGVLYGAFRLLRQIQTRGALTHLAIASAPKLKHRILDHWDNLDGTIERGYAGFSIFNWWLLPDYVDPRLTDYARADASIGVNGVVLNNVNADPLVLTPRYLKKAAALADVFRPYGIRVYLSVNFASPVQLGALKTSDPLDPTVQTWWKDRADEIYRLIPDFGGYLVKANSEGQPGPQDYGRTHADGANMLARTLKPHDGLVMWRAFVYAANKEDRIKQAYDEFKPLDGKFDNNVMLQVKNGALDFQPREPFHPLFGAMPHTNIMLEVQVTKEYMGFATHLVYLGQEWQEVLRADTYAKGAGSTVAKVIDGSLFGNRETGIAGVANVGDDRNWCGSIFNQANWYAFGRLAWNPEASAADIASDWARMTFTSNPAFVKPVVSMMIASREAVVNYMTPLGLAHQMGTGHHYGPAPWVDNAGRPDWNPVYYARAAKDGIGVDRTATGSNAVAQYFPPVAEQFADLKKIPDEYLLWFHHVPWDYKMRSGRTLWDELVHHYSLGVDQVHQMRATWQTMRPYVDAERFDLTDDFLGIQEKEAKWWRDASIAYFQTFSQRPLPPGEAPPPEPLSYYESLKFPYAPGVLH